MRRTSITLGAALGTALVVGGGAVAGAAAPPPRSCVQPNGRVSAIAIDDGTAFLGGTFTAVKGLDGTSRPRAGAAAVDITTCQLLSWAPATDGEVAALAVDGSQVFLGGAFTKVNGESRPYIASVSRYTASVNGFRHNVSKPVHALAVSSTTLYAGGDFRSVDGASRQRLAAFDLGDGQLQAQWKPVADASVRALTLSPGGSRVYVGGNFQSLAGDHNLPYLGAVDSGDGSVVNAFRPHADFPMLALATDAAGVYAGGGGAGGHLGLWNPDGSLQQPIYQTDGGVQAVALDGDTLYAGGHFTNYCQGNTGSGSPFICDDPLPRRKLFQVSLATGKLTDWAPVLNSPHGVFAAQLQPGTHTAWTGGDFTKVNGKNVAHLAVFD